MENIAKPTKQQLDWHEMELGVLIHYCLEMYRSELPGEWYKTAVVREALAPERSDAPYCGTLRFIKRRRKAFRIGDCKLLRAAEPVVYGKDTNV